MLARSIESFLNQDYENCELIILNDGGDDVTQTVIDYYQKLDSRITCVRYENNVLPPKVFNQLLEYATGDLVCHLHDDDEMLPNGISLRVEAFKKDPNLQVVYAGWKVGQNTYYGTQTPDLNLLLKHEYICYTTLMWKRSEVDGRFDEDFRYYHDWYFKIKCLKEYRVVNVIDPVISQGIHLTQDSVVCRQEGKNAPEEALMRKKLKENYGIV